MRKKFNFINFFQVKQLARIGGMDIKSITGNILRTIMNDSVAVLFSYIGGKKNIKQLTWHGHVQRMPASRLAKTSPRMATDRMTKERKTQDRVATNSP